MNMSCVSDPNFIITAIAVMILLLVPMALPILKSIPGFSTSKTSSIIAGMSLSAIFVFMIPDIIGKISQVAAHTKIPYLKQEFHLQFIVFATVLVSFCVMYALEKISFDRTKNHLEPSFTAFWIHMGIICVLLICLVSSYPALSRSSFYAISVIAAVSIFGIFLEEIALQKHFGSLYSHAGRYILMLAIVIGWSIGLKFFTQESNLFTLMTESLFVGLILLSVIKTEFDLILRPNNHITFICSAIFMVFVLFGLMTLNDIKHKNPKSDKHTLDHVANHDEKAAAEPGHDEHDHDQNANHEGSDIGGGVDPSPTAGADQTPTAN